MLPTRTLSLSNTHSTSTTLSTPFVVFGDACVSERAVVDVIDLVVEAEYARDRYEGNCPERSRFGQLTYLRALGGPGGPLGGPWGVPGGPEGSRGGQGALLEGISFCSMQSKIMICPKTSGCSRYGKRYFCLKHTT